MKSTVLKIEPIALFQKMQFEGGGEVIKLMSQVLYFRKFCEWEKLLKMLSKKKIPKDVELLNKEDTWNKSR